MMKSTRMFRVIENSGRSIALPVPASGTLAAAIWLSGETPPPALCSGLGRCGACRVRFAAASAVVPEATEKDTRVLGPDAVAEGWRLACEHSAQPGMVVEVPPAREGRGQRLVVSEPAGARGPLRLAVDLGTTSVHWRLFDSDTGDSLEEGRTLNPQMGAGSDVVSRLAVALAPEGRARLRELVLRLLRELVEAAAARWHAPVAELCVAGNTAMTGILLDVDISGLAAAPYRVPHAGGIEAELPGLPPVWIPPQAAPFVGGDLSAGMAWLLHGIGGISGIRGIGGGGGGRGEPRFPFLLADLGTNGEFVLALDKERAYIASVPMGPSLEGIGLSRGGMAGPGAVDRFSLEPGGLRASIMGGTATGEVSICGTGYLSLLECLLKAGVLEVTGGLATGGGSPLAARLLQSVRRDATGWRLLLPHGLVLGGEDVEEILKVKAAFSLAVASLLRAAGLASSDLAVVELAGALGEHVPVSALERLGFLPQGLGDRVHAAGNTSLNGAALLLSHPELREANLRWSRACRLVELAGGEDFTAKFVGHMTFQFPA